MNVQCSVRFRLGPLNSAQIGKNDIQFPANFYVSSYSLSKHVCSNACVSSINMLLVCCFI